MRDLTPRNRLTQADRNNITTTWTYDAAYQLIREHRPGVTSDGFDIEYAYDPAGNRVTETNCSGACTTYVYDEANQLQKTQMFNAVTTFIHDEAGNRIEKQSPVATSYYAFDDRNQLAQAEVAEGVVTMTYNGDGQRVSRQSVTGEEKRYLYDFKKLLQESDDDNDPTTTYNATLDEYGELLSEYDESTEEETSLTFDGQWSAEALVDEAQAVTERYKYRAFGLITEGDTDRSGPTFKGDVNYQPDTDLDLYLLGAGNNAGGGRHYDPATGRFLSQDPIGFAAGDENLYRYVGNNPVNAIDPGGQQRGSGFAVSDGQASSPGNPKSSLEQWLLDGTKPAPPASESMDALRAFVESQKRSEEDAKAADLENRFRLPDPHACYRCHPANRQSLPNDWYERTLKNFDEAMAAILGAVNRVLDWILGIMAVVGLALLFLAGLKIWVILALVAVGLVIGHLLDKFLQWLGLPGLFRKLIYAVLGFFGIRSGARGIKWPKWNRPPKTAKPTPPSPFHVDSGQLGKKLGKHAQDFGLDPAKPAHRKQIADLIDDIGRYPERSVPGSFRGQGPGGARGPVEFRIKGNDVVVTTPDGKFVTILKDGINNPSVIEALANAGG